MKKLQPEELKKQREACRRYYIKNKVKRGEANKKQSLRRRKERPWAVLLSVIANRASKSGKDFNLTEAWCKENYTGVCGITGMPFSNSKGPYQHSVDRIDNNKGYTQDNCRFILLGVNTLKGIGTDEDVIKIAKAILKPVKSVKKDYSQAKIHKPWNIRGCNKITTVEEKNITIKQLGASEMKLLSLVNAI